MKPVRILVAVPHVALYFPNLFFSESR